MRRAGYSRHALSKIHQFIIFASHRRRVHSANGRAPPGDISMKRLEAKRIRQVAIAAAIGTIGLGSVARADDAHRDRDIVHVLLISVDGMHASDLANYVSQHPQSGLARLSAHGFTYPKALTSAPSDSFPGLLAQVTGGTPKSHGVFYDNSYDRTMFAPGS